MTISETPRNPEARLRLSNGEVLQLVLFASSAPQSVRNFIHLSRSGFYNGQPFWRIQRDELIQSGSPKPDGTGSAGYAIKGEFNENGVANPETFSTGTLGFGLLLPDGASSAFFIVLRDTPHLDGRYAAFGRLTAGIEIAREISRGPSESAGGDFAFVHRALDPVFVETIEIEDYGVEYPLPEKLPEPSEEAIAAALKSLFARSDDPKSDA